MRPLTVAWRCSLRPTATLALVATIAGGVAACDGDAVAVRVGRTAITAQAVTHWMKLFAPEHRQYRELQRRALEFLISAAWVTGAAAEDGLHVAEGEVRRLLREDGTPAAAEGGDAADERFAARVELAEGKLRNRLARSEPAVTSAQVAAYYRAYRGQFLMPEKRYIDVANFKTPEAARTVRREVEVGHSTRFIGDLLHEEVEQPSPANVAIKPAVRKAILAARPNVLIGPLYNGEYALVEVKRVVAARYEPLAQVQSSIARRLAARQRRATLSRLIDSWRRRWLARTDCSPGYVVQKCRQYSGPLAPEDPLAFD